jgi:hypothetical protein
MTPSTFAELRTAEIARQMGVMVPDNFRVINGRVRTPETASGGGIVIGAAYTRSRRAKDMSGDELHLQSALLEPRTAHPLPLIHRIAGAIWRWC